MKILLVMESWNTHNGPYETLYPYFRSIFEELGHSVQLIDNKKNYLFVGGNTVWDYPNWMKRIRWLRINNWIVNLKLIRIAEKFDPDLILILKGENIYSQTIAWLKQNTKAIIINWDHDNPFWYWNTSIDLLRSIPLYDAFGAFGQFLFTALDSIGCQRAIFLPMFYIPERFVVNEALKNDKDCDLRCDVAFVGNGSPERAEMLRHLVNFNLGIWGDWRFLAIDDPLQKCLRGHYLGGKEYAKVIHCSKIAINVMNQQCKLANNTRTFEITGMGGFLLSEYTSEQAEQLFIEDQEIVCFRSATELKEKVNYYLVHENERNIIANCGKKRTWHEHLLQHRLQTILKVTEDIGRKH